MAFFETPINVADLPQNERSFDPLPAGTYSVVVHSTKLDATKSGGTMLVLRLDVEGPTHQGRVLFARINVSNPSETAERIGREQLGDICRAIGLARVGDTDQLIGNSLTIKLDIEKSEQYGDKNQVKGFKPIAGGAPPRAAMAAAPAAAPAKAAPPWAKK